MQVESLEVAQKQKQAILSAAALSGVLSLARASMQATPLPAVEVGSHGRTGEAARSTQPAGWASARQARGLAQKTNRLTEPTMEMLSAAIQVNGPASGARGCVHAPLR